MAQSALEAKLEWIGSALPRRIEWLETPPPEEAFLSVIYYPDTGEWGAQVGANYGGWIDWLDTYSEGPVYYGKRFDSLEDLADALISDLLDDGEALQWKNQTLT